MASYDYRGARDKVMGIIRDGDGRPVGYVPSETPIRERMLIVALVEFAPDIRPALSTLSVLLGVSESEVRRLLHAAARRGLIHIESRPGRANRYHLTLSTPSKSDTPVRDDTPCRDDRGTPSKSDTPPLATPLGEADKEADNTSGQGSRVASSAQPTLFNESKKPKKRSKSKIEDPPDPRVTQLRDHYVAEYLRTQHAQPIFDKGQWGRAMKAFKSLIEATKDLERSKRIVSEAFVTEQWDCRGKIQPWEILGNANKLNGAKPSPPRKTNGYSPQHSGVDVIAGWGQET